MLDFIATRPEWIISYRTDFLTSFFSIFPLFATEYFYIACIALGHWHNLSKKLWISLGFLIPLSTLLNYILKYLFRIDRPDILIRLVPVDDNFSFPSGGMQVGYIFWMSLFFAAKNNLQEIFCIFMIVAIGVSRIYLGVHTIFDVIGGLLFGCLILDKWRSINLIDLELLETNIIRFWILPIFLMAVYIVVAGEMKLSYQALASFGAMIGFALSLPIIKKSLYDDRENAKIKIFLAFASIALALLFYPKMTFDDGNYIYAYYALKYAIISFLIFGIIPHILNKTR